MVPQAERCLYQSQDRLAADELAEYSLGGSKTKSFPQAGRAQGYHHYGNVLNQEFSASLPNQKWVTDITYIATLQGWTYLSTIKYNYERIQLKTKQTPYETRCLSM